MEQNNQTVEKKSPKFGINPATWIFVFAAFVLAVILFVFPVSHSRYMYYLLGNTKESSVPFLFSFPLLGLLAGCIYSKIWRIVVCSIIAMVACATCFFVEGAGKVTPSWGAVFLAAGVISLIGLAATSQEKLERYPNPFRDAEARGRWIYAGLAVFGTLFFFLCYVTAYKIFGNIHGATGSTWIDVALFSDFSDGWYLIILPIISTAAALCAFLNKKVLNCAMSLLMYIPALLLVSDIHSPDYKITMSTGFYVYLLCVTAMLIIAVKDLLTKPKADSAS